MRRMRPNFSRVNATHFHTQSGFQTQVLNLTAPDQCYIVLFISESLYTVPQHYTFQVLYLRHGDNFDHLCGLSDRCAVSDGRKC